MKVQSGICDLSQEPAGLGQALPLGRRPPLVPLTVTAALDGTGLAKGELSPPQLVIVLFVRRSTDVPPESTVLETLASNDIESPNVTGEAVCNMIWWLCSQALARCLVRPFYRCVD